MKGLTFTIDEKKTAIELARKLTESMSELANGSDRSNVLRHIKAAMGCNAVERDVFGLNPIVDDIKKMDEEMFNSVVFEEFDEQYMYFFAIALVLFVVEMLIGERKAKRHLLQ